MSWTDDRVDTLKKLWNDGESASAIAHQLGEVTRNAVIGKVHRLGLAGRANQSRKRNAAATARLSFRPARRSRKTVRRPRAPGTGSHAACARQSGLRSCPNSARRRTRRSRCKA